MQRVEEFAEFWAQLKRHEGEKRDKVGRHEAYICPAGRLTIGWGHNLEASPIPNDWFSDGEKAHAGSVITNTTAEKLLRDDVAVCARQLDSYMYTWRTMKPARQAVLLNMCFNMGWGGLKEFKKMLDAVKRRSWREAAAEMQDSRWARQVKGRAKELSLQMLLGEWIDAAGRVQSEGGVMNGGA